MHDELLHNPHGYVHRQQHQGYQSGNNPESSGSSRPNGSHYNCCWCPQSDRAVVGYSQSHRSWYPLSVSVPHSLAAADHSDQPTFLDRPYWQVGRHSPPSGHASTLRPYKCARRYRNTSDLSSAKKRWWHTHGNCMSKHCHPKHDEGPSGSGCPAWSRPRWKVRASRNW